MPLTKEEINRKLLHILSGSLIPAGIFYIPKIPGIPSWGEWLPMILLGAILAGLAGLEWARLRVPAVQKIFYTFFGATLRSEESKTATGATWIFAASFLCTLIFMKQPHISFMVICMFILGDAVAALVGISIGRIKIGKKSLEGSLACLALSLLLLLVVFPLVPGLLDAWNGRIPLGLALIAAFSNTIFELFPLKLTKTFTLNDNLTVPLITGVLMKFLYPFMI